MQTTLCGSGKMTTNIPEQLFIYLRNTANGHYARLITTNLGDTMLLLKLTSASHLYTTGLNFGRIFSIIPKHVSNANKGKGPQTNLHSFSLFQCWTNQTSVFMQTFSAQCLQPEDSTNKFCASLTLSPNTH